MLRFFPMPYPDETIYSMFARYDKLVSNNNYYATIKELFGNMYYEANFYFACNLEKLYAKMPSNYQYSTDDFINNNTILPLYKLFIPVERYDKVVNTMKCGKINSALAQIGYLAGGICKVNGIKYCDKCLKEDKFNYGEAYIHRNHQIQGNIVCSRHKTQLKVYETQKIVDGSYFFNIDSIEVNNVEEKNNKYQNELYELSVDIDFLLNNENNLFGFEKTRKKYYSMLYDKGYMSKKGLINQIKLHEDFIKFYSLEFLHILQSSICVQEEKSWLRTIIRKKIKTVHPIRNLLFIKFLFKNLENYLNYKCHDTPVLITTKKGDKYKEDKQILYDINLEEPYKKAILELISKESNLSRRDISKKLNKEYRWLYANKREWFEAIMPRTLEHIEFYKNDRIDWIKRDEELSIEVEKIIDEILQNEVMKKVTIHLISQNIKYKGLINSLDKLPETKKILEQYCESISDFHKRKIKIVINNMYKNGDELKRYLILRNAGISSKYYYDYDEFIEKQINDIQGT